MAVQELSHASTANADVPITGYTTYHCICSELIVALPGPIHDLPKRERDRAHICELDGACPPGLVGITDDVNATILKLEDGFEKRYLVRCARCGLMVAYHLDQSQFEQTKEASGPFEGSIYFLSEALITTKDMEAGKGMGAEKLQTSSSLST